MNYGLPSQSTYEAYTATNYKTSQVQNYGNTYTTSAIPVESSPFSTTAEYATTNYGNTL